jgi:hypothetical protein
MSDSQRWKGCIVVALMLGALVSRGLFGKGHDAKAIKDADLAKVYGGGYNACTYCGPSGYADCTPVPFTQDPCHWDQSYPPPPDLGARCTGQVLVGDCTQPKGGCQGPARAEDNCWNSTWTCSGSITYEMCTQREIPGLCTPDSYTDKPICCGGTKPVCGNSPP